MNVRELAEKYKGELVALRREFHKNPELSWKEIRTGNRVEEELKKIGIEIKRIAKTGVVGTLKGREGGKIGKVIRIIE